MAESTSSAEAGDGFDGTIVGTPLGNSLGPSVGMPVRAPIGTPVGTAVDAPVGMPVGTVFGIPVGMLVGTADGIPVEGEGIDGIGVCTTGIPVGTSDVGTADGASERAAPCVMAASVHSTFDSAPERTSAYGCGGSGTLCADTRTRSMPGVLRALSSFST